MIGAIPAEVDLGAPYVKARRIWCEAQFRQPVMHDHGSSFPARAVEDETTLGSLAAIAPEGSNATQACEHEEVESDGLFISRVEKLVGAIEPLSVAAQAFDVVKAIGLDGVSNRIERAVVELV